MPPRSRRSARPALLLAAGLLLAFTPGSSLAHEPGLSTGHLRILPGRVEAELTLSRVELETLLPLDTDGDGEVSKSEWATAENELRSLAQAAWVLRDGDRTLAAETTALHIDQSNNVQLGATFLVDHPCRLVATSTLPARLPRGHRQFVSVLGFGDGASVQQLLSAEANTLELAISCPAPAVAPQPAPQSFAGFFVLGIEHIVTGFDHLLFLLALLVMAPGFRQAAWIITAFTAAHSITLALATLRLVPLDSRLIEPLIAATLVCAGVGNLLHRSRPRRSGVFAFAFGLVHGFGFASVLRGLGIGDASSAIAPPLLAFNLGVETGQIALAAAVLPILAWARQCPIYDRLCVPALSILVAGLGVVWCLQRIAG